MSEASAPMEFYFAGRLASTSAGSSRSARPYEQFPPIYVPLTEKTRKK